MIKAIIFDLNGIFVQSRKLGERFEAKYKISNSIFFPALKDVMSKVRLPGAEKSNIYWEPYFKEWKLNLTGDKFLNFWFQGERECASMTGLAKDLKEKGTKLFILSNNFLERAEHYRKKFSFMKIFDKVYYSWQTGFIKPDVRAYKKLLYDNQLKPEECIYLDDSEENVSVANELGITSFHFKNASQVKKILKKFGILR